MTRWANEHSSDECRKRAQSDEAFKKFMQTRLKQEMRHEQAVTEKPAATASPGLISFAEAYNKAESRSLRPINGIVTLNGQKYQLGAFNALVEAAGAAHLIF